MGAVNKICKAVLVLLLLYIILVYYPHPQTEFDKGNGVNLSECVIEGWQGPEVRRILPYIPNALGATKYVWYQESKISVSENETALFRFPETIDLIVTTLPENKEVNFSELVLIESPDENYTYLSQLEYNETQVGIFALTRVTALLPGMSKKVHFKAYFQMDEKVYGLGYYYDQRDIAQDLGERIIYGKCII